ncbi:MAG: glycosyltransferase family 1 protein [Candidatus Gracilibacteria bacterium]|nr:glycosyltransferase family 1 protein [bacterium]MDZ4217367.1 glycosyltransferase family 1 protein [Candidatus Gracilibacteria bacterium]
MILGIDCSRYAADQPTGVELYTDRIVEGLVRQADRLGYEEVRLYVKNARQVRQLLDLIETSGQQTPQVKLIERRRLWTLVGLSWELLRWRVDVLFIPSHALPLVLPRRSFLTVHGVEALLIPQAYTWFQRMYQRFVLWWAKRKGARLIAVSAAVKKNVVDILGIYEKQVTVVWNGFDRKVDKSSTGSPRVRATSESMTDSYEDDKDVRRDFIEGDFILSVGRLEVRKNQLRLVQAFERLAGEYPKLKLVLVGGNGYGAERIKEYVHDSPVRERVYLAGYQDREVVRGLMERALVFAYPSLVEGFGIPILEAFDAGVPVLTSRGSATEEVAGNAAVFCDPLSVGSILETLKRLLEDEKLRSDLVKKGGERVGKFSWERCVEGMVSLLKP